MSEAPKLFVNKPKKSQLKQSQASASPSPSSSSSASASMATSTAGSASASAPPQPPKESFARRYRFLWPLLLAVNFSIGAYLFLRTKKKDVGTEEEGLDIATSVPTTATIAAVTEKPVIPPPIIEPTKLREPIPEDHQRELFKWLLEEKRKIKPKDSEERKRIDEEKAILKQFIRAKSIPTL